MKNIFYATVHTKSQQVCVGLPNKKWALLEMMMMIIKMSSCD